MNSKAKKLIMEDLTNIIKNERQINLIKDSVAEKLEKISFNNDFPNICKQEFLIDENSKIKGYFYIC